MRSRLLEEIDRWRGAMMGAVSHDLRTPLASIKAAVSSLRQNNAGLSALDQAELLELIEQQSDRLARLVTNLLDMTRIESGALAVRPVLIPLDELVAEALAAVDGLVPPKSCVPRAGGGPAHVGNRSRADRAGSGQPAGERGAPLPPEPPSASGPGPWASRRCRLSRFRSPTRVRASRPTNENGSSKCSVRTAAAPGPVSGWPSPRHSSRPMAAPSGSTPTTAHGARVVFTVPAAAPGAPWVRVAPRMTKVLVVDDDLALLKALRIGLTARGDEVATRTLGHRRHHTGRAVPS